jgi:mannose-6-phosphate isomerase-like protein (cupin superfamily)
MPSPAQQRPINLTATAESMPWSQAQETVHVLARSNSLVLEIRGLDDAKAGHPSAVLSDNVYVIISGYGVLRCGDTVTDCTAGDVLFVPRGRAHHFERLNGEIRIWRISLSPTTASPTTAAEDGPG